MNLKSIPKGVSKTKAYNLGYEAGRYGANVENCHFSIFLTERSKDAWEKGNRDGKKDKESELNETTDV